MILAIQQRAQRDVELGKAQQTINELDVLFGDQAAAVGLSMSEALEIYEQAYVAATPAEPWWDVFRPLITWAGIFALVVVGCSNREALIIR